MVAVTRGWPSAVGTVCDLVLLVGLDLTYQALCSGDQLHPKGPQWMQEWVSYVRLVSTVGLVVFLASCCVVCHC
jgi:hypothetical protein